MRVGLWFLRAFIPSFIYLCLLPSEPLSKPIMERVDGRQKLIEISPNPIDFFRMKSDGGLRIHIYTYRVSVACDSDIILDRAGPAGSEGDLDIILESHDKTRQ